jgi:ABC-type Fe3+-siderophore transport system permease subunit
MKARWQDWINLVFGLWLFFSPWLLQYFTGRPYTDQTFASWNSIVFGAAVVFFAARTLFAPKIKNWEEWANLILGLWLIASPWIWGFHTHSVAAANMVIVGLVIAVFSGTALGRQHSTPAVYR